MFICNHHTYLAMYRVHTRKEFLIFLFLIDPFEFLDITIGLTYFLQHSWIIKTPMIFWSSFLPFHFFIFQSYMTNEGFISGLKILSPQVLWELRNHDLVIHISLQSLQQPLFGFPTNMAKNTKGLCNDPCNPCSLKLCPIESQWE